MFIVHFSCQNLPFSRKKLPKKRKKVHKNGILCSSEGFFRGIFSEIFRDFSEKAVFLCFFVAFSRRLTVYRQLSTDNCRWLAFGVFSLSDVFYFSRNPLFFYFPTNCTNVTNLFLWLFVGFVGYFKGTSINYLVNKIWFF